MSEVTQVYDTKWRACVHMSVGDWVYLCANNILWVDWLLECHFLYRLDMLEQQEIHKWIDDLKMTTMKLKQPKNIRIDDWGGESKKICWIMSEKIKTIEQVNWRHLCWKKDWRYNWFYLLVTSGYSFILWEMWWTDSKSICNEIQDRISISKCFLLCQ